MRALFLGLITLVSAATFAQQVPVQQAPSQSVPMQQVPGQPVNPQYVLPNPSQQPLQDQSLSRPVPTGNNMAYPLPDQDLSQPPAAAGTSADTSQEAAVSGTVQISPRTSSGPSNAKPWPTQKKDQALTQKIRKNLLNQDANFAKTVVIDTRNGVVTLTGQVATPAQKSTVEKIARAAAGKSTVKSELTVAHD